MGSLASARGAMRAHHPGQGEARLGSDRAGLRPAPSVRQRVSTCPDLDEGRRAHTIADPSLPMGALPCHFKLKFNRWSVMIDPTALASAWDWRIPVATIRRFQKNAGQSLIGGSQDQSGDRSQTELRGDRPPNAPDNHSKTPGNNNATRGHRDLNLPEIRCAAL
jgi:hypothetical protein